jgi:hypothetical protein
MLAKRTFDRSSRFRAVAGTASQEGTTKKHDVVKLDRSKVYSTNHYAFQTIE